MSAPADAHVADEHLLERYSDGLMRNFGAPRLALVKGAGAQVWDVDGKQYTDLLAGIAVNSLGHAHPAVVDAVSGQLQQLGHISNLFTSAPQVRLAEELLTLTGREGGRVFFSNSGSEANEAAFKISRLTGRQNIVATEDAFHGRTMGPLALTSKEAYRTPFEPLPGTVTFVPYGDVEALRAAVNDQTAAFVVEPIQGEAGVNVPPSGYLAHAREITADAGALLWLDEIQTGIGRTGDWFASDLSTAPEGADIVTLAKGLGGGFPIGATLAFGSSAEAMGAGAHGTTFGGNPVACAAALAVLEAIRAEGLLVATQERGEQLRAGLAHPRVSEIRGAGLMIGLTLDGVAAPRVQAAAQEAGFIINAPTPDRIRLVPPLVITEAEIASFVAAWPGILEQAGVSE